MEFQNDKELDKLSVSEIKIVLAGHGVELEKSLMRR